MRIVSLALTFLSSVAFAQEQENQLVNRILKPDTTLANPAQNKRFRATAVLMEKQVLSHDFYVPQKSLIRHFESDRAVAPSSFPTDHFRTGDVAHVGTPSVETKPHILASLRSSSANSLASGAAETVRTRSFSGDRPFLARGKSQKALSAHDTPLSIEQVRELLNKNK